MLGLVIDNIKQKYDKDKLFFLIVLFFILKKYLVIICNNILQVDNIIIDICYLMFLICTIVKIVLSRIGFEEILLLLVSFTLYIFTKDMMLIIYMSIAIAAKDIDFKKVVKYFLGINLILFLIVALLVAFKVLPDVGEISYRAGSNRIRNDFGFLNPNIPFLNLLPVFTGYMYLKFDTYNIYDRLILLVSAIYIYIETDSRTGFISILSGMIILEVVKRIDFKSNKFITIIASIGPIIISLMSIFLGTVLSQNYILNKVLSYRPVYWSEYLGKLTLWGGYYNDKLKYTPLDNSYIYILSISGIIMYILIIYILCKSIYIGIKDENKAFIVSIYTFLIYAISENVLYDRPLNFPIILAFIYFLEYIKTLNIKERLKFKN